VIYLDIETDGLSPTVIWCAVTRENGVNTVHTTPDTLCEALSGSQSVIGHNLIGYDLPALERLWGVSVASERVLDTLILSRLADPSRSGGHSLAAWGNRLGYQKGDYNDWSHLNDEMIEYCKRDTEVTEKVYQALTNELAEFSEDSIQLEHKVAWVITQQERNGWLLDQKMAHELIAELKEKQYELQERVQQTFYPLPVYVKSVSPRFKKDGTLSSVGLKFLGDRWTQVAGDFSRIDFPEFNLGSRQQIGKYLMHFGWKPEKFTETGQPIVDESVLSGVSGIPEAQMIAEYLLVQKRIAQVQSWLEHVENDGRVHGQVVTNGAVTGRMTHRTPNMAQVPASYSPYGKQCRQCWTVPQGKSLVGFDASGLELRMLAHYMNDKEYTNVLLREDIHTRNQMATGLETRAQAKTFIYAFLYGAGDAKIGAIVGGNAKVGSELKERFLRNTPALADLRDRVGRAAERGYVKGLDGRKLWVRSNHSALNTLLQGAGAIVMKQALVTLDDYAQQWDLDYKFVGNVHDEVQSEVVTEQAEKFGWLAVECLKAAGVHFGLRCPLDGEFKVGRTWEETH